MAKFIKHIGRHNDRKVAVVFREVPNESHMALVVYTELIGKNIHDPMMSCIESDIGQQSENLADALNRSYAKDGRPILQVVHSEGQLKKVKTEQIVMTPQPGVEVKLSELNDLLNEMKKGEDAIKRLAEMDQSRGLQDPADVARRMRENANSLATPTSPTSSNSYLPTDMSDAAIAWRLRDQSLKMEREAKGLLAESQRLKTQADEIEGISVQSMTEPETVTIEPVAKKTKAGRPKKEAQAIETVTVATTTAIPTTTAKSTRSRKVKNVA